MEAVLIYRCFNATTAFLLPFFTAPFYEFIEIVSMPPRRSCFQDEGPVPLRPYPGFNATTAFLLPGCIALKRRRHDKFQCHHGVPASFSTHGP